MIRPGGRLHPAAFLAHGGHVVVEALLALALAALLTRGRARPRGRKDNDAPLTDAEVDALCAEWEPVPLVPATRPAAALGGDGPLVRGGTALWTDVGGRKALNCGSFNYLGLAGDASVKEKAKAAIIKYGVGSCGPRGFYGTIDVHLYLETALAKFMGTEEAIMYS